MNTLRKLSLAALAVAPLWTTAAGATDLVIGAGSDQGEYTNTIVPAIDRALRARGHGATAAVSVGSAQNIADLRSGKLAAALSQMDVAALALEGDASERYAVLGRIAPEALLCAVRKDGRVRTYHDLTDDHDQPLKISVGPEQSGTAQTFQYLMRLDPELANVRLIHKKRTAVELSRLASGNRDAVCFVMMPNPDNSLIALVADNPELQFMEFVNPPFANVEVNDFAIYDFMEVPVTPGVWGLGAERVNTLVTSVSLVVDEEGLDGELLTELALVVLDPDLLPPTSAAGKANELWKKVSAKAKEYAEVARRKTAELVEAAKSKAAEMRSSE